MRIILAGHNSAQRTGEIAGAQGLRSVAARLAVRTGAHSICGAQAPEPTIAFSPAAPIALQASSTTVLASCATALTGRIARSSRHRRCLPHLEAHPGV